MPYPDFTYILSVRNIGESRFLMNVLYNRTVPDTWDDMYERLYGLVVMDLDSLELTPVIFSDISIPDLSDQENWTDVILMGADAAHTACRLTTTEPSPSAWYEIQKADETLSSGAVYTYSSGTYTCEIESGMPQISPVVPKSTGVLIETEIKPSDEGIRIELFFTSDSVEPEYLVPEAITSERMKQFLGVVAKKTQKKIMNFYRLYDTHKFDRSGDKEELLLRYPALAEQPLYVLRDNISDSQMEKLQ